MKWGHKSKPPILPIALFELGIFLALASLYLVPYALSLLMFGDFRAADWICRGCGF